MSGRWEKRADSVRAGMETSDSVRAGVGASDSVKAGVGASDSVRAGPGVGACRQNSFFPESSANFTSSCRKTSCNWPSTAACFNQSLNISNTTIHAHVTGYTRCSSKLQVWKTCFKALKHSIANNKSTHCIDTQKRKNNGSLATTDTMLVYMSALLVHRSHPHTEQALRD